MLASQNCQYMWIINYVIYVSIDSYEFLLRINIFHLVKTKSTSWQSFQFCGLLKRFYYEFLQFFFRYFEFLIDRKKNFKLQRLHKNCLRAHTELNLSKKWDRLNNSYCSEKNVFTAKFFFRSFVKTHIFRSGWNFLWNREISFSKAISTLKKKITRQRLQNCRTISAANFIRIGLLVFEKLGTFFKKF